MGRKLLVIESVYETPLRRVPTAVIGTVEVSEGSRFEILEAITVDGQTQATLERLLERVKVLNNSEVPA